MTGETGDEQAHNPQALERLLIARQWSGDVDGMTALYEADAVIDSGDGRLARGRDAIRTLFEELKASGKKFSVGKQSPAVIAGDLALTSTHLPDGNVTAEVARRQSDGTWLWVIDRYTVT